MRRHHSYQSRHSHSRASAGSRAPRRFAWAIAIACLIALGAGFVAQAQAGAVAAASATVSASELLSRLKASERPDLAHAAGLPQASVAEGTLVCAYPDLRPLYFLCPIETAGGRVMGSIAIDAVTGQWAWYSLHDHGTALLRVGPEQAGARAMARAAQIGAPGEWAQPVAVRLADKRVYWMIARASDAADGAPSDDRLLVDVDDPDAPVLATLDGSLEARLASVVPAPRYLPPADWRAPDAPAPRLPIPAVYDIPDIPFHFQVTSWYCGCAAVQMLLDYYGEEIGQVDISDVENDLSGSGTYGSDNRRACHFSAMSAAAQNPALQGYSQRALGYAGNETWLGDDPFVHLKNLIAQGIPVEILCYYDRPPSGGHFRVVKGYDDGMDEFIMHDPWYTTPFYGPDLHMNQDFLVGTLWDPYTDCWAMMTGPWTIDAALPDEVAPGAAFQVVATVRYPGAGSFTGQYPTQETQAQIELPAGFSLASGSPVVTLPSLASGGSAQVTWNVIAGTTPGRAEIGLRSRGIVNGNSYSYPSYSDSIGGHARVPIVVGDPAAGGWLDAERLTQDEATSSTAWPNGRSLAVEPGGAAHIVYADARSGNSEVYYRRWETDGWDPEVRLTTTPNFSDNPVIAVAPDGDVHVAWIEVSTNGTQELFHRWWNGSVWSAPVEMGAAGQRYHTPSLAADGQGNVHAVWQCQSGSSGMIYYSKWDGTQWATATVLAGTTALKAFTPSVAVDAADRVYALYEKMTVSDGTSEIFCRIFQGGAWAAATQVSTSGTFCHSPSAAVAANGTLHVVWQDARDLAGDIYYRTYDGTAWGPETHIVDCAGDSQWPSVAASANGCVHVVWQDYRDGEAEIYHKEWTGAWGPDERLTDAPRASSLPCVGVDAFGSVQVLWTDERDGNSEVYIRQRIADAAGIGAQETLGRAPGMLRGLRPSPALAEATIDLELPVRGPVLLQLFDLNGRLVRTLLDGALDAGPQRVRWDGRDQAGVPVRTGALYCRLRAAGAIESRPLLFIRR
jgi:hypothetical protein